MLIGSRSNIIARGQLNPWPQWWQSGQPDAVLFIEKGRRKLSLVVYLASCEKETGELLDAE